MEYRALRGGAMREPAAVTAPGASVSLVAQEFAAWERKS